MLDNINNEYGPFIVRLSHILDFIRRIFGDKEKEIERDYSESCDTRCYINNAGKHIGGSL